MSMEGTMGAMPVYNVCDNQQMGFGGNWIWVLVLLMLFGWGGVGFGRRNDIQGFATQQDIVNGFNFNQLDNGIRGLERGICDLGYSMQGGFNSIGNMIAEAKFAAQNCCCETNRNIDAVRYEAAKNTCDITSAIHAEGEATRALINQNTMQDLRDRLADRDRELMAANFQISQVAQTNTLIDRIKPCAIPAYLTCSPYTAANNCGFGGSCGFNTSCGC